MNTPTTPENAFHFLSTEKVLELLNTSLKGLSDEEFAKRQEQYGYNEPAKKKRRTVIIELFSKFLNPLVIVLLIISVFSMFFGEKVSALFVMLMAILSVLLSFIQEHRANQEVERLNEMVRVTATVIRNGKSKEISIRELVPGDIVDLFAGDMIPADLRVLTCKDLFINQSTLTGESMPVEKYSQVLPAGNYSLSQLSNVVFMGSSVVSGTGLGVVVNTGTSTQFGKISQQLARVTTESSFDKGINQFMWVMIRFMVLLVVVIFLTNYFMRGDWVQAFLFSLAVAVGLTPEMLPMILALNLSKGAIAMSKKQVIVKRLSSMQNFGAMDVLCTDKTGTLTLDKIILEKYCDIVREESNDVLKFAYLNSYYQTGLKNLLDRTILKHEKLIIKQYKKIDEIPFDFSRRIMSVVIEGDGKHTLISKGAPEEIFKRCQSYELDGEIFDMNELLLIDLRQEYETLSADGFRVIAVAYKDIDQKKDVYSKNDEQQLILKGYLAFLDPPKPTARQTIDSLKKLGIEVKVLTGDNDLVTKKICSEVGLNIKGLLNGDQLDKMDDQALREAVENVNVFARLAPLQKERIIRILRKNGHIVGYLGDGINDAPALKTADVGISVDRGSDIAKESADIILLKRSLIVIRDGVVEGRKTFGNILKYIKMGSSSNLGNMISMTLASFMLPFLPMLPIQVLLTNFLYDLSQVAIPTDDVDEEYVLKCRSWNINYIKRFMLFFGPISSIFDFITFGVLLFVFQASEKLFHTGWFLESLCTQTLIIHIIRTGKVPFIESKPSPQLIFTSVYIITIALVLPFTPLGNHFGFVIPPWTFFIALFLIICAYLMVVQIMKEKFIKKYGYE